MTSLKRERDTEKDEESTTRIPVDPRFTWERLQKTRVNVTYIPVYLFSDYDVSRDQCIEDLEMVLNRAIIMRTDGQELIRLRAAETIVPGFMESPDTLLAQGLDPTRGLNELQAVRHLLNPSATETGPSKTWAKVSTAPLLIILRDGSAMRYASPTSRVFPYAKVLRVEPRWWSALPATVVQRAPDLERPEPTDNQVRLRSIVSDLLKEDLSYETRNPRPVLSSDTEASSIGSSITDRAARLTKSSLRVAYESRRFEELYAGSIESIVAWIMLYSDIRFRQPRKQLEEELPEEIASLVSDYTKPEFGPVNGMRLIDPKDETLYGDSVVWWYVPGFLGQSEKKANETRKMDELELDLVRPFYRASGSVLSKWMEAQKGVVLNADEAWAQRDWSGERSKDMQRAFIYASRMNTALSLTNRSFRDLFSRLKPLPRGVALFRGLNVVSKQTYKEGERFFIPEPFSTAWHFDTALGFVSTNDNWFMVYIIGDDHVKGLSFDALFEEFSGETEIVMQPGLYGRVLHVQRDIRLPTRDERGEIDSYELYRIAYVLLTSKEETDPALTLARFHAT